MEETLILVDNKDRELGRAPRSKCHKGRGKRHRAFIIFLFNREGRLLLQRRANGKLWGGFWDCSAGSHVLAGETYQIAVERCLQEELDISTHVRRLLTFNYVARSGADVEKEFCVLYVGEFSGSVKPNPIHISQIRYLSQEELEREIEVNPIEYTPWFIRGLTLYLKTLNSKSRGHH